MCGVITFQSQTWTVQWIGNFIPHFTGHVDSYPWWYESDPMLVKWAANHYRRQRSKSYITRYYVTRQQWGKWRLYVTLVASSKPTYDLFDHKMHSAYIEYTEMAIYRICPYLSLLNLAVRKYDSISSKEIAEGRHSKSQIRNTVTLLWK